MPQRWHGVNFDRDVLEFPDFVIETYSLGQLSSSVLGSQKKDGIQGIEPSEGADG